MQRDEGNASQIMHWASHQTLGAQVSWPLWQGHCHTQARIHMLVSRTWSDGGKESATFPWHTLINSVSPISSNWRVATSPGPDTLT